CCNSAPGLRLHADRTRQGKRALRGGAAPLQADRGKDRASHRIARPRVLRKADCLPQAKARRRRQAALQAPAQPDAAAETLLIRTAPPPDRPGAMEWTEPLVAPFHFENPTPRGNQAH